MGILGSLDDKIELNRRINANLEAQAQALFRSWFVDFEPFRDGPFVDSELGKIPASLKIEHIGNIPHKIESGKRPKGGASEHGIPSIGALRQNKIHSRGFCLNNEKGENKRIRIVNI